MGSRDLKGLPHAKVSFLPTFYFPDPAGQLQAVTDSTPIIRRLEGMFLNRSVRPANPALALIDAILEDYGDEWLTKAMFHYRWHYADDIAKSSAVLPSWRGRLTDDQLKSAGAAFAGRQIPRLRYVGSNEATWSVIEASYTRFLDAMEKHLIDRRMAQMEAEGVTFRPGTNVGTDVSAADLRRLFDATVLAGGSTTPRDLAVPGRELAGIHFAMDFLPMQNKTVAGDAVPDRILATGKRVVILGGGDTGSDCLGTSNRHGALSVHQFELLPMPPSARTEDVAPWPYWPMTLRTSSSHEEGVVRDWSVNTKHFSGDEHGNVKKLHGVRLEWQKQNGGPPRMVEAPGSEFEIDCDLVLLALGFVGPEKGPLLTDLGLELDPRGNVQAGSSYATSVPGVFSCGDMRRGQSLVVWAIWEGREAARGVDTYLMGETRLAASPLN